jgi:hypothetical protein
LACMRFSIAGSIPHPVPKVCKVFRNKDLSLDFEIGFLQSIGFIGATLRFFVKYPG